MEANNTKTRTFYKVSSKGKIWEKKIKPGDWKSKVGYLVEAKSSSEQEAENLSGMQKLMVVKQQFPNNMALQRIVQRRTLELIDLTTEELREVEEEEKKRMEMPMQPVEVQPAPAPEEQQLAMGIQRGAGELAELTARR